jgi:cytochrome c-type biogenesis protein CcmH
MRHVLALLLLLVMSPAHAVKPGEQLADPAAEKRARHLSAELRCLVCQNQSIDDSDAELAQDLRRLVRERIAAGDDDATIRAFLVARYGEFVLLRPPVNGQTVLLWSLPLLALLAGFWLARRQFRKSPPDAEGEVQTLALSDVEAARLAALLEKNQRM